MRRRALFRGFGFAEVFLLDLAAAVLLTFAPADLRAFGAAVLLIVPAAVLAVFAAAFFPPLAAVTLALEAVFFLGAVFTMLIRPARKIPISPE